MIIYIVLWIVWCAINATIAERKGHKAFGYMLISVFLSPLVGMIIVLCLSNRMEKLCVFCAKKISIYAKVCPYCNKQLGQKTDTEEKNQIISKRIIELIENGASPSDAKIQAEAEYQVKK